jgi:PAS domain S-box-containing protein
LVTFLSVTLGEETNVQWLAAAFMFTIGRLFSDDQRGSGVCTAFFFALSAVLLVFCLNQSVFRPIALPDHVMAFFKWNSIGAFLVGTSFSQFFWFKHSGANDRRSEEMQTFLKTVLDNLPVSVFVKNPEEQFKISLWNKASERIFGISPSRAIGHSYSDFLSDHEKQRLVKLEEAALKNPEVAVVDSFEIKSQSGSVKSLRSTEISVDRSTTVQPTTKAD